MADTDLNDYRKRVRAQIASGASVKNTELDSALLREPVAATELKPCANDACDICPNEQARPAGEPVAMELVDAITELTERWDKLGPGTPAAQSCANHLACLVANSRSTVIAALYATPQPAPVTGGERLEVRDLLFQIDNLDPAEIAASPSMVKEMVQEAIAALPHRACRG